MQELEMLHGILNSYPYPIVFVDNDYIIRYMNQNARYHYYQERGYHDLIGSSLLPAMTPPPRWRNKGCIRRDPAQRQGSFHWSIRPKSANLYAGSARRRRPVDRLFERFELNLQK